MAFVKSPDSQTINVTYNTPSQVDIDTANVADSALGWDPGIRYAYALVQNTGSTNLFLRYGSTAATTSVYHTKLVPGTQVDLSDTVGSSLNIISDANNGIAVFTLATPDTSVSVTPAQPSNNINGH
tara:strand:- start:61 stop:438 length:378 start_codon:yes stop_codon:yes gene_type:complete